MKEITRRKIDLIIKIVLISIIILLLIRNCTLLKENKNEPLPGGNIDVIDIECDDNECETLPKEIESINFLQEEVSVKKDETIKLIPIIKPSSASSSKLAWKSNDPSVATVDDNGVVKGIKSGTVTITVESSDGKKATCIVTVTIDEVSVKEIKLMPNESVINSGSTTQVVAEIIPKNATNRDLVWTSSDTKIAVVDSNGYVKGLKSGTVIITAKTKDGKVVANTTITIEEVSNTGDFEVYDNYHTPLTWNGSTNLKIFSNPSYTVDGKIAPESSNTYQFMIRNSTVYKLKYKISFTETNNYHINMKYKLKKNDTYLIDHYVSATELNIDDIIIDTNENDTYYLEWKWVSSSNDTSIGTNPEAKYGIKIEVEAEGIND